MPQRLAVKYDEQPALGQHVLGHAAWYRGRNVVLLFLVLVPLVLACTCSSSRRSRSRRRSRRRPPKQPSQMLKTTKSWLKLVCSSTNHSWFSLPTNCNKTPGSVTVRFIENNTTEWYKRTTQDPLGTPFQRDLNPVSIKTVTFTFTTQDDSGAKEKREVNGKLTIDYSFNHS